MEYSKLIAARYSVRAYRPNPVEDEKLQAVLEAARLAPTAHNFQPIQLVVMRTCAGYLVHPSGFLGFLAELSSDDSFLPPVVSVFLY